MQMICKQNLQEEDWGFLLIYAQNAFNEENQTTMLWVVRSECSSGVHFTFKIYSQ